MQKEKYNYMGICFSNKYDNYDDYKYHRKYKHKKDRYGDKADRKYRHKETRNEIKLKYKDND